MALVSNEVAAFEAMIRIFKFYLLLRKLYLKSEKANS